MAKTAKPNPIDISIGGRIRAQRLAMGMSQEKLADALGLTFQQVQKYEKGSNRVSGSRLVQIANALMVSPSFLMGETAGGASRRPDDFVLLGERGAVEMLRAYVKLPPDLRITIVKMLQQFTERR